MNDTNTTAAQPLDLDFLEEMARNRFNGGLSLTSEEALALIAQARAAQPTIKVQQGHAFIAPPGYTVEHVSAQPESATLASQEKTTGARVPTWQARLLAHGFDSAQDAMEAEIADLRAQLAAKGQGKPECAMCNDSGIVGFPPDQYEDCPDCIKARDAAPASAQPDDELDHGETVLRVQEALGITRTGWVSPDVIMLRIEQLQNGSAQPDRGGAAPVYAVGASASIDGIADELEAEAMNYEGDFADTVKGCVEALREIAPSPASQPVAPIYQVKSGLFPRGWHDISVEQMAPNEQAGFQTRTLYTAPVAVAPSDAKDAARYVAWRDAALSGNEKFVEAMQDAMPADKDDLSALEWDTAIDAAMAAAPSSAPGKEGEA